MKLVIFGLTVSSSWGNGHATLWRGLCRALAERGHRVVFFEKDVPYYAEARDMHELPGGGSLVLYRDWQSARPIAARETADCDVAMVTSYNPDGIAATDLVLDSRAPVRAFYDLDTPVTLDRLRGGERLSYIGPRGLRDFDLVLSYTGGSALDRLQTWLGAARVAPLYGSVDPTVHRPAPPDSRFASDLSYLGTYAQDRQDVLDALFIEPARRLAERRFLIAGAQYPPEFPWTTNIHFVRHLDPAWHPSFYSSSRLTLNITRRAMKDMGFCPSGRLFEAAACGAPILSDDWEGLERFFEPGEELMLARTSEEAIEALRSPDESLHRMSRRARERVLDEHTAAHRVNGLEAILDGVLRPSAEQPSAADFMGSRP